MDRGVELAGPNQENYSVSAPVNVGNEVVIIDDIFLLNHCGDRGPFYPLLHVNGSGKCDADAATVWVRKAEQNGGGTPIRQGLTDDDGYLRLLGICKNDTILIIPKNLGWGEITYTGVNEIELPLTCPNNQFSQYPNISDADRVNRRVSFEFRFPSTGFNPFSQAIWYPKLSPTRLELGIQLKPDSSAYECTLSLDSGFSGVFFWPIEDSFHDTVEYVFEYYNTFGDTLLNITLLRNDNGTIEIELDSSYGNNGTISLLISGTRLPSLPEGFELVSNPVAISFGDMPQPLSPPANLVLTYFGLDSASLEAQLRVCRYNFQTSAWSHIGTPQIDTINNTVEVAIDSSGTYGLFSPTCIAKPGDCNGDGKVDLADIICMVNHVFKGALRPSPLCRGDANADTKVNLTDIVYLVNYIFKGGPPPQ